jgi:uncharacterized membrane protein HdeD (DUF308 family)
MAKKKNENLHIHSEVDFGQVPVDPHLLGDMWWLLLIRAISLVVLGFLAILWPGLTLITLAVIFGIYLLVNGIMDVIIGIRSHGHDHSWFLKIVLGFFELVVGVFIIHRGTLLTIATFILLLGLIFIFQGIAELVSSFRGSRDIGGRLWHILLGLLGLVAGIVVLRQPVASGIAFTWFLGFYALFAGTVGIAASLGLRSLKKA